jgi:hypothetical protein
LRLIGLLLIRRLGITHWLVVGILIKIIASVIGIAGSGRRLIVWVLIKVIVIVRLRAR